MKTAVGAAPVILALAVLLVAACDRYPRDAHGSLEQILEREKIRVGVIHHPPWAGIGGVSPSAASGVEVQLVEDFASQLDVEPVWHAGTESEHFASLEQYELDLVIGGMDRKSPWGRRVAFTLPYYTEQNDVGTNSSGPLSQDLEGVPVAVLRGSGLRKSLIDQGAVVHSVGELAPADAPLAAPLWKLRDLDLRANGIELPANKRVMAVPPGENALLMRLERFLLEQADKTRVEQLLAEYAGA